MVNKALEQQAKKNKKYNLVARTHGYHDQCYQTDNKLAQNQQVFSNICLTAQKDYSVKHQCDTKQTSSTSLPR